MIVKKRTMILRRRKKKKTATDLKRYEPSTDNRVGEKKRQPRSIAEKVLMISKEEGEAQRRHDSLSRSCTSSDRSSNKRSKFGSGTRYVLYFVLFK